MFVQWGNFCFWNSARASETKEKRNSGSLTNPWCPESPASKMAGACACHGNEHDSSIQCANRNAHLPYSPSDSSSESLPWEWEFKLSILTWKVPVLWAWLSSILSFTLKAFLGCWLRQEHNRSPQGMYGLELETSLTSSYRNARFTWYLAIRKCSESWVKMSCFFNDFIFKLDTKSKLGEAGALSGLCYFFFSRM